MLTPKAPRLAAALALVVVASVVPQRSGLAQTDTDIQAFPETGHVVKDRFLQYWNEHGGLAQQGFPITGDLREKSDTDGKVYRTQYFERTVFELHPENQPPNDVLLSLLGVFRYKQKYPNGAPGQVANNSPGSVLFKETGKRVGGVFLDYWKTHGGLAQQGYPISDEFQEKSDLDGKTYTVQYFERAVFEYHPENQAPYNVLLSQLGTFQQRTRTGAPISFVTEDGFKIGGLLYGHGTTAVVLSHSCVARGKTVWNEVAESLASLGYMVITYDFRGFGDSRNKSDTQDYDPNMYPLDLKAAIAFARQQGATRIVLGGGSCGGFVTVKVAVTEQPAGMIVMAAPMKAWDMEITPDDLKAITAPKLFISSEGDTLKDAVVQMYDLASEPKEKQIYAGGAHATAILDTEAGDDLMQHLLGFIEGVAPVGR